MPKRTILLRLMLWSLALAAGAGVLAVLFQGGALVWRIVGTGLATAAACVLLIACSSLIDRERTRTAGLLGMVVVIVEYLVALGLIWQVVQGTLSSVPNSGDKCGLSMVFVGLATAIIMAAIQVPNRSPHKVAAQFGVVATGLALATLLIATWWPTFSRGADRWWGSAAVVVLFGALTTTSLFQLSRETPRRWRYAGIAAAALACLMLLRQIWMAPPHDPVGHLVFCGLLAGAGVVAHANFCMVLRLRRGHQWVRSGTIVFAAITAALIFLLLVGNEFPASRIGIEREIFGRLAAAGGIVTGCGTLALLVLSRMYRKVDAESHADELAGVDLLCPRCRKKQAAPLGDSTCPTCGLRIFIRVEEPRCVNCDYLLRGLTSERCPECGLPIATRV